MDFIVILEQAATQSSFVNANAPFLLDLFNFNSANNGLHVARMFFYNNRLITFADYVHYLDLSERFSLNLRKKMRYLDHVCYFRKTSDNMVIATLFTNEAVSALGGLGHVNNISLTNVPYRYANPPIIASPLDFFQYFWIINDINNFPQRLPAENAILDLVDYGAQGFRQAFDTHGAQYRLVNNRFSTLGDFGITTALTDTQDWSNIYSNPSSELRRHYIDTERSRMVRTLSNGSWVDPLNAYITRRRLF